MYQLSRLLHDYHRELYCHLEKHNIGPSLYATPWFLTIFASHFPLGFVARVFGTLSSSTFVFRISLSLLCFDVWKVPIVTSDEVSACFRLLGSAGWPLF